MKEHESHLPLAVSVREAARMLSIGYTMVYHLIKRGELRHLNMGTKNKCGKIIIPIKAIHDYLETNMR